MGLDLRRERILLIMLEWEVSSHFPKCCSDNALISATGVVVKNQQFGVATTSQDMVEGILGIGPGIGLDTNYLNFIDQLAAQGLIQSRAFSLDLGSIDVSEGTLISHLFSICTNFLRFCHLWRYRHDEVHRCS